VDAFTPRVREQALCFRRLPLEGAGPLEGLERLVVPAELVEDESELAIRLLSADPRESAASEHVFDPLPRPLQFAEAAINQRLLDVRLSVVGRGGERLFEDAAGLLNAVHLVQADCGHDAMPRIARLDGGGSTRDVERLIEAVRLMQGCRQSSMQVATTRGRLNRLSEEFRALLQVPDRCGDASEPVEGVDVVGTPTDDIEKRRVRLAKSTGLQMRLPLPKDFLHRRCSSRSPGLRRLRPGAEARLVHAALLVFLPAPAGTGIVAVYGCTLTGGHGRVLSESP